MVALRLLKPLCEHPTDFHRGSPLAESMVFDLLQAMGKGRISYKLFLCALLTSKLWGWRWGAWGGQESSHLQELSFRFWSKAGWACPGWQAQDCAISSVEDAMAMQSISPTQTASPEVSQKSEGKETNCFSGITVPGFAGSWRQFLLPTAPWDLGLVAQPHFPALFCLLNEN